jgi:hypothetical protein
VPCSPSITPDLTTTPTDLTKALAQDIQSEFADQAHRTIDAIRSVYADTLTDEALRAVLKSAPTPIEKRRAASTLLRALDGSRWHRSPSGVSGCHGSSGSAASRARRFPSPTSPSPSPRLPDSPSHPPSITPDLTTTPTDLTRALAKDLQNEFANQPLATIDAIRSVYADTLTDEVLEDRLGNLPPLTDEAQISDPVPFDPPSPLQEGQELTITDAPSGAKVTLRFVRFHHKPWRLIDLNTG